MTVSDPIKIHVNKENMNAIAPPNKNPAIAGFF